MALQVLSEAFWPDPHGRGKTGVPEPANILARTIARIHASTHVETIQQVFLSRDIATGPFIIWERLTGWWRWRVCMGTNTRM